MSTPKQMALLLSKVNSPSQASFIETLCFDSTIKRDMHRAVVRKLAMREIEFRGFADRPDAEEVYEDGMDVDESWGDR